MILIPLSSFTSGYAQRPIGGLPRGALFLSRLFAARLVCTGLSRLDRVGLERLGPVFWRIILGGAGSVGALVGRCLQGLVVHANGRTSMGFACHSSGRNTPRWGVALACKENSRCCAIAFHRMRVGLPKLDVASLVAASAGGKLGLGGTRSRSCTLGRHEARLDGDPSSLARMVNGRSGRCVQASGLYFRAHDI